MSKLNKLASLISQTLNVLIFDGNPDESVSARSYREGVLLKDKEWLNRKVKIDKLFKKLTKEVEHCKNAHETDVKWAKKLINKEHT